MIEYVDHITGNTILKFVDKAKGVGIATAVTREGHRDMPGVMRLCRTWFRARTYQPLPRLQDDGEPVFESPCAEDLLRVACTMIENASLWMGIP